MKKLKSSLLAIALTVSFSGFAWEKNNDYLDNIYTVQADQIETTGQFKRNLEFMYNSSTKDFGMSFYNYRNKADQIVIPVGSFNIRGCGIKVNGNIDYAALKLTFSEHSKMRLLASSCGLPIYVRVYDLYDNYATYRIETLKGFNELK
ncbi:hypothetical protein KNT64_gp094 [Pseudomonas phage PspYZU05]|uniref:Uncharacterized protein n=1 Tax=Pseudomonas phage PspYZU05 TaxID=1983556 RepID=A0A2U7N525_9CAUD|nr:hypothetical protein KNT64_gp094 [Pseudomonas phage PspYZU05]ASD52046.1 hypothetical protein PspYZU05_94 [Pseudomonas phage PspYZU05]